MMGRTLIALLTLVVMYTSTEVRAAELVYFGSDACSVCETWDQEVGEIYPKTPESKVLALRHVDVHDEKPADLSFIKGVIFTPTFVAVENGREIGRIVGYMGDFFFWEQLDGLVKKLTPMAPQNTAACPGDGDTQLNSTC